MTRKRVRPTNAKKCNAHRRLCRILNWQRRGRLAVVINAFVPEVCFLKESDIVDLMTELALIRGKADHGRVTLEIV